MSDRIQVQMPDGTVIDAPAGTTKAQIEAKWKGEKAEPEGNGLLPELGRVADKAIRGGLLGMPRMAAELVQGKREQLAADPNSVENFTPAAMLLKATDPGEGVRKGLLDAMTPSKPQTTAGQYAGAVLEGAVGGASGASRLADVGKTAVTGAAAGMGGELAAKSFGDNMLTRLLGGLAGGGIAGITQAIRPNAENLIKTSTKGMTQADWRRAAATETQLNDLGMPHLKSQLLGPNSSLDDVVKDASSNQRVRPTILQGTRGVTDKAGKATDTWAAENLPVQTDERRDFMAGLQRVAADKEKQLLQGSNTAYRQELRPGVMTEVYPEEFLKTLRTELTDLAKNPERFGLKTEGGAAIMSFVKSKLSTKGNGMAKGELNNIVKDLNILSQQDGYKGLPLGDLKKVLKDFTVDDFGAARNAKAAYLKDTVEPMQQGLAGTIAHQGGGPRNDKFTATADTLAAVFPLKKEQPLAIKKLAEDVGGEQVGLLLREHLMQSFNEAAKASKGGVGTPAKFTDIIGATPAQQKNVEAALMETAKYHKVNPYAVRNGFYDIMKAFKTYEDLKIASSVDKASLQQEAGKSALSMMIAPASRAGRFVWDAATAKTYQKIADMVTSPDGLRKLEDIAKRRDPSYTQAALRGMLTDSAGADRGE